MMKKLFLFALLFVLSLNSFARRSEEFFPDVPNYPLYLKGLLGTNMTDLEAAAYNNFQVYWRTNKIDSVEKIKIVKLSNLMYDYKSRIPQFHGLIMMIDLFKEVDSLEAENYGVLIDFLPRYVTLKKTTPAMLNTLFQDVINLLNGTYIVNSTAYQWQYQGGRYFFQSQDEKFWINFQVGKLTCFAMQDSISIFETSGAWYPFEKKWIGKGGLITWERSGFSKDSVNAFLKNYEINLTRYEYKADSVSFIHAKYFDHPILGKITDKVAVAKTAASMQYPQFDSYSVRFLFKDLYDNVDYDGGFSLRGAKIIGSGNETADAKIVIKNEAKELMTVKSKYFTLLPDRINGLNTQIKINVERDSIYHSDLIFNYFVAKQEVTLSRTEDYSSRSPFTDSYHKLDIDFEQLIWKIDQPKISFTMAKTAAIGKARFESQNYFNMAQFEALQGREGENPLVLLSKYSRIAKSDKFSATQYATYFSRTLSDIRQVLMYLTIKGFIFYDSKTDMIEIKQRLRDYIRSSVAKIDYDVIAFNSLTEAPNDNATLNMETFDLKIQGIPNVSISDSQNVAIYPSKAEIIMKKNRSFNFDGVVDAGLFTFYGKNFFFNYDDFKLELQNVDSVSLKVYSGEQDQIGRAMTKKVRSVIEHLTGDILIDKPDNKSGRKNFPEYPKFTSRENSYVYYQRPDIESGVYKRSNFYFEVYPFVMDSLDNFSKNALRLPGKLNSADILPVIENSLAVQPDYSLGFRYNPGPGGIPVYNSKAILYSDVSLSNLGLHGLNGRLAYITSNTQSKDFKLYPDSMNTQSSKFNIAQQFAGVQYPTTSSEESYIHWNTRGNEMFINQGKAPFNMFNPQTSLAGALRLNSQGLEGSGLMALSSADLRSKHFKYLAQVINADTSRFLLKSLRKDGYTVLTEENVNSHIDFSILKGEFKANEDFTKVDFPENQYISYLDYFKWNMDQKTLEMGAKNTGAKKSQSKQNVDKERFDTKYSFREEAVGPRYISVAYKQDSLNFVAPSAIYDYQNNLLNASNVKLIRAADAVIYTADGKVTVEEGAKMRTLKNVNIAADPESKMHQLHSATIDITGRNYFFGFGKYDYVDDNKNVRTLEMTDIHVDSAKHTIAKTALSELDTFFLNRHFQYQGSIVLNASRPLLNFDGATRIRSTCSQVPSDWLRFTSEINPLDVMIPIDENPVSINNKKLYAGIMMSFDSIHIFPTFLSARRNYADKYVATASGWLHYNRDSAVYEIASKEKLSNRKLTSNYLSLDPNACMEYVEGSLNLQANYGQVQLQTYGRVWCNLVDRDTRFDVIQGMRFMFDPEATLMLANRFDSIPGLSKFDIKAPDYLTAISSYMGTEKAWKYVAEATSGVKVKEFPDTIKYPIHLAQLRLRWVPARHSYMSEGKIAISNMFDNQVNKYFDGVYELTKKPSADARKSQDILDLYLKIDEKTYYYWGYTPGVMQVYGSYPGFLQRLKSLPAKQREMDVPRGQTRYIYMMASDVRFAQFMSSYKRYLKQLEQKDQPATEEKAEPADDKAKETKDADKQTDKTADNPAKTDKPATDADKTKK